MLNLIPKNIIPSFKRYLIAKVKPLLYLSIFFTVLLNIDPIKIAIIIGDMGLFSRFSSTIPI